MKPEVNSVQAIMVMLMMLALGLQVNVSKTVKAIVQLFFWLLILIYSIIYVF